MDTGRTTVVGVFENRDHADRAVEELRRAGFGEDQIGYAMRNAEGGETISGTTGSSAGEGLATGAVIGGLVGAAAALLIPGIGPVVAGGVLASVLGGAAVGAAAGGILGALVGMGVPEEEATYYEGEFQAGRTLVTVRCGENCAQAQEILRRFGAYDIETRGARTGAGAALGMGTGAAAANAMGVTGTQEHAHTHTHPGGETHAHTHGTGHHTEQGTAATQGQSVQLRAEQLNVEKERVQAGQVEIKKQVVAEQKTVEVPVTREEVVIERRPVNEPASGVIGTDQDTIRIPVMKEEVRVEKTPVVTEEISVSKRPVTETQQVNETVRREEAVINRNFDRSWSSWDQAMPHFRSRWQERFGTQANERWEDWEPRYRFGWEQSRRSEYQGRQWGDFESQWRKDWEANHVGTPWERAGEGVRDAWEWASGSQVRR